MPFFARSLHRAFCVRILFEARCLIFRPVCRGSERLNQITRIDSELRGRDAELTGVRLNFRIVGGMGAKPEKPLFGQGLKCCGVTTYGRVERQ